MVRCAGWKTTRRSPATRTADRCDSTASPVTSPTAKRTKRNSMQSRSSSTNSCMPWIRCQRWYANSMARSCSGVAAFRCFMAGRWKRPSEASPMNSSRLSFRCLCWKLRLSCWIGEYGRVNLCPLTAMAVESRWALYRRDGGDPVSVLEFDSDITETRRAQTMLKERESCLRSILDTAPDAIVTIDESGIIQSFRKSAEKLFGYAPGEVIGCNFEMLMPAPHRENHDGYLPPYLRIGEKHIIGIGRQVEARRKDGTIFPMDLAVGEVTLGRTHIFTRFI